MLFVVLAIIAVLFFILPKLNKTSTFVGGKKAKDLYLINLDYEKSKDFLAYLAIEYAIDNTNKRFYNRTTLEKGAFEYLDVLLNKMKSKDLIRDSWKRVLDMIEQVPKHETLGKPLIIKKLMGLPGDNVIPGELKDILEDKPIQADTNIYRNTKLLRKLIDIGIQNNIVITTQILCDSKYNQEIPNIRKMETGATYKVYLNKEYFLSYNCRRDTSCYSFLNVKNVKTSSTISKEDEIREVDKIKNDKERNFRYAELYMSKAVKDIGIIISSVVNKIPLITQDAWVMMVANKVFNIEVIYSRPSETMMLYRYKKKKVDGYDVV